jgi:hypothetical protein
VFSVVIPMERNRFWSFDAVLNWQSPAGQTSGHT